MDPPGCLGCLRLFTQIHSDQGRNFESQLFGELCRLLQISKTRTTPYRPQSDGLVERFNRTLQQMLKTLVNNDRNDWDDLLPFVLMAYRATPHESTGCSPNLLMLGRETSLPIDILLGVDCEPPDYSCPVEYVEWMRRAMTNAHDLARQNLKVAALRQKTLYDKKGESVKLSVGQFVWRFYPPAAKQKLGKPWIGPFRIVSCPTDIHCNISEKPGQKEVRVHIDQLKLYQGPRPEVWVTSDDEAPSEREEDQVMLNQSSSDHDNSESQDEREPSLDLRRSRRQRKQPFRLDL